MSAWWKARRRPFLGLALAIVAVLGVYAWLDLLPSTLMGQRTVTASADGKAELGGQQFELHSTRWEEFAAPDDTRSLSVTVTVYPGEEEYFCGPLTLSETQGKREWTDTRESIGAPWDAGSSFCDEQESASYRLFAVFLIPDDVAGPFWLTIEGDIGESVRFLIEV